MTFIALKPRKALNKAFLKVKPNRTEIDAFKANLIQLLDQINEKESEEFHKNIVSKFLDVTYYSGNHYINTKGRNDLVIHNGKDAKTSVGVIVEAKKPTANKAEMLRVDNLNSKAFHELVLYYLRERITGSNIEIKYVIATNIHEWFIFDAEIFDKAFAQDKEVVKRFIDFEEKRLSGTTTDFFYKEIAEPAVENLLKGDSKAGKNLTYTHFDIREIDKKLRNKAKEDDTDLIPVYKLFSPEHLLKLPFKNDSNSLDKSFYSELLHIIGLTEVKDGGKKLIDRKEKGGRDEGSLLENTITQLDTLDKVSRLEKPSAFGSTNEARFFNVGLELVITWINRILFLKLLEAQLVTYHKGDKSYSFLNAARIKNFDDLNSLFFQVLAKQADERGTSVKEVFSKVPYLNSSLFEPTELEHSCLFISQLQENKELPILSSTVLKDNNGKKKTGKLNVLQYLFEFLDAYDFSSEGSEDIQEENKTLISASVLGLIFEKINGYKDGSFFTPGFITMYMCRETIRRAIIQKFNDSKDWKCSTIEELFDKIDDKKEANSIINSLKICDPAVGSGHFLVSALNEIISAKSDLKILLDRDGKTLRDYDVEVSSDELTITDEEGKLFDYNPKNKESQRIQEALFHEKQAIIESCLFGVDINPNSVKICRLRLWIELLKNAYYKADSNYTELETLPNIDINIKCGNSLISRFQLDVDLSQALKKSKVTIKSYKQAVQNYRHAESKEQKREMEQFIGSIKSNFRTEISNNDPKVKRLSGKRGELDNLLNQHSLFEPSKSELKERAKLQKILADDIFKLESQIEEIKSNKVFENAFEWRFEFPEVLNDNGDFDGFDVIIGNPPYGIKIDKIAEPYYKRQFPLSTYKLNLYTMFIERFTKDIVGSKNPIVSFIVPNSLVFNSYFKTLRQHLIEKTAILEIVFCDEKIFEEAEVGGSLILEIVPNFPFASTHRFRIVNAIDFINRNFEISELTQQEYVDDKNYEISLRKDGSGSIIDRVIKLDPIVKHYNLRNGLNPGNVKHILIQREQVNTNHKPIIWGKDINYFKINWSGDFINYDNSLRDTISVSDIKSKPGMNKQERVDFALRTSDIFEVPKIVVRKTGDKVIAAIDRENFYFDTLAHGIYEKMENEKYSLEYLIGILNSDFATWLYRSLYNVKGKVFAKISLDKLETLPIPEPDGEAYDELIEVVNEIKLAEPKQIQSLQNKLNSTVCRLYGLTPEESQSIKA